MYHASDVFQLFGLVSTPAALDLQDQWINFVTTLSPNPHDTLYWPANGANATLLEINESKTG